jgi:hypothetical protein
MPPIEHMYDSMSRPAFVAAFPQLETVMRAIRPGRSDADSGAALSQLFNSQKIRKRQCLPCQPRGLLRCDARFAAALLLVRCSLTLHSWLVLSISAHVKPSWMKMVRWATWSEKVARPQSDDPIASITLLRKALVPAHKVGFSAPCRCLCPCRVRS